MIPNPPPKRERASKRSRDDQCTVNVNKKWEKEKNRKWNHGAILQAAF
jgi:hypothetical protein